MKILVYGAGAVGGYLGARLAHSGQDVTLISRQVMADIINDHGLILSEGQETIKVQPKALTSIAQAYGFSETAVDYDLIIMTMKSYDLATAIDHLVAFCPEPPPIIAVQNGINVEGLLVKQFGAGLITAGALTTPISKESTNRLVVERDDRGLSLTPLEPKQNIKPLVNLFEQAGITTIGVPDYRSMKWSKALLNMVGNATSAILNRAPGAIYKIDALFDLEVRMLRETLSVMRKSKIQVIDLPGSPATRLAKGVKRAPKLMLKPILTQIVSKGRGDKMPSFHIDLMSGKGKSEVIYHNGAIAKAGPKVGVLTPVNMTLTTVLMQLTQQEIDWREYDGNAKRLLGDVKRTERMMRSQTKG